MKKGSILFFFLCSFFTDLISQSANDKLSPSGLNIKFIEHLIKEKIDEVRIRHDLKPLYNDSILYVAAKHHAEYLFNKKQLSHFEPENTTTETPQKRAEHFGAINYLVGENVAQTAMLLNLKSKKGKIYSNSTYDELAADFIQLWVNSPGHFKNIITSAYNSTGLAVYYSAEDSVIYAVQKFANILYEYDFIENKRFFPYSNFNSPAVAKSFNGIEQKYHSGKHAHKLKAVKDSAKCVNCYLNKSSFAFGQTHIEFRGENIYLVSYSYAGVYNLLKKRKDGFAAEIVTYGDYDCGNPKYYTYPSRRNKQCVFSGKVLKPVYRKEALQGFKPGGSKRKEIKKKIDEGKVRKYELKLGKIPKDIDQYFEVNLVVIQKKRVCDIMHFSSFCGDTLQKFYDLPFLVDTIRNSTVIRDDYRTITFNIPFEKGKTEYKMSDIKPITDSLLSENFIVDSVVINAFASIEGAEITNKELIGKRANNLASVFNSNQKENYHKTITSAENWNLFEKQVRDNKDLEKYKGLTAEKVKELLKDTIEQKRIEKYLARQRTARIRLRAREIINNSTIEKYITKKVKELKKLNLKDSLLADTMDYLLDITYNHIKSGVLKPEFLETLDIGDSKAFDRYNYKKWMYWAQINGVHVDSLKWGIESYEQAVHLYNDSMRSFIINYNMLNLVQRYGKNMSVSIEKSSHPNYVGELKQYITTPKEEKLTEKLALNFYFPDCGKPIFSLPKGEQPAAKAALRFIHDHFKDKRLSDEETNKLAEFYLYHGESQWVYDLLWPMYKSDHNNSKGLVILAKTLYTNYQEYQDLKYYEMLMNVFSRIPKDEFCAMFIGPCNTSFQVLDYEKFKDFYCEKCGGYLNYAKAKK
jgi:uncharacterized protein YkwD